MYMKSFWCLLWAWDKNVKIEYDRIRKQATLPQEVTSQSRDVNKHGGGVNDLWTEVTSHVNEDGGRPCLRWSLDVNKDGGWPNFNRQCGA